MNTANLQLEGICAIMAGLLGVMRDKGLLNSEEIDQLLEGIEKNLASDPNRPAELRGANVDAICFPARFLRLALQASSEGHPLSFAELTGRVGLTKPNH
jgi:hypothetical protein